ncbi:MAG: cysteine desulfurase family protein [Lactobacillus sp.]|nr:cysteine desulfurase family protein [Lactobacillus sp.]
MTEIYLDNAATTPMLDSVIDVMTDAMKNTFGNASATNRLGQDARKLVDDARHEIATFIGAKDGEIIFTSGATEGNNTVIKGISNLNPGKKIITTAIEHPSVLRPMEEAAANGHEIIYLSVDQAGCINFDELREKLTDDVALVSVMAVNNEVGSVNPLKEIGQIVHESNALFHVDAVQGIGNLKLDVNDLQVDFMTTSAHKINGPKFLGFLYVRDGVKLPALILGGEQENKRRAGTENVPAIAGFGQAIKELKKVDFDQEQKMYASFQDIILNKLKNDKIEYEVNGGKGSNHVLNLWIKSVATSLLQTRLDLEGFAVSAGSACTAGAVTPSHVLTAMFGDSARVRESIRISFGRLTTTEEVTTFAEELANLSKKFQIKE